MKYHDEIWHQMADRFMRIFDEQVKKAGLEDKLWKPAMARDFIREAYRQGARAALKMAEEIDEASK